MGAVLEMAAPGKMTIDELLQSMPKMMRIADDMHNMTSYINDLRILTIVMVVAGAIGGIGFLLFKLSQSKTGTKDNGRGGDYRRNSQHFFDEDQYRWNELHSVRSEGRGLPEKVPLRSKDVTPPPPPSANYPGLKGTPEV